MLADMTAQQFADWWTLSQVDPWGDVRADWRAARQAWATLRPYAAKRRLREVDFLLRFRRTTPAVSAAQFKRRAAMRYERHIAALDAIEQQRKSA